MFLTRRWVLSIPLVALVLVWLAVGKLGAGTSGRAYIWEETFKILPWGLLGEGPAAFALDFPQDNVEMKKANGWTPEVVVDRPHNFFLQVWHASGLFSLLALLVIFGRFLWAARSNQRALPFAAATVAYLVNMIFTDSSTSVAPLFWILLGSGIGALW